MYIEPLVPHIVEFGLDSTLIERLEYFEDIKELDIHFKRYYIKEVTYEKIELEFFLAFVEAKSKGRFYLQFIKPFFLTKNNNKMSQRVIKCKIDVMKINKDWLYAGDKGTYLNFTMLLKDDEDVRGNHGMLIQDVPTEIYKKEKAANVAKSDMTKGEILGNVKDFSNQVTNSSDENKPGVEGGKLGGLLDDDLPF